MPTISKCLVCQRRDGLISVRVGDGTTTLCSEHHTALGPDAEATFVDERALLSHPALDRRGIGDRRGQERRMFPRAEGRRIVPGRRADDPRL